MRGPQPMRRRPDTSALQETLKLVQLGPRKEDIAAAKAMLKANQAALDVARKALADASLYAPDNGIIQERILEPGDMASPQRPVYTLALTDPVWVRAYVQGPDLGKLKPGMRAESSTDSFPGKNYRAWVGYISPTAEFTPKSVETTEVRSSLVYQVRIFVCNPQDELRLGMPATVIIHLGEPPAAGRQPLPGLSSVTAADRMTAASKGRFIRSCRARSQRRVQDVPRRRDGRCRHCSRSASASAMAWSPAWSAPMPPARPR